MFKELTRIKGTDLTVKEAREKILEAFGGSFAQETKTETVLFFEEM